MMIDLHSHNKDNTSCQEKTHQERFLSLFKIAEVAAIRQQQQHQALSNKDKESHHDNNENHLDCNDAKNDSYLPLLKENSNCTNHSHVNGTTINLNPFSSSSKYEDFSIAPSITVVPSSLSNGTTQDDENDIRLKKKQNQSVQFAGGKEKRVNDSKRTDDSNKSHDFRWSSFKKNNDDTIVKEPQSKPPQSQLQCNCHNNTIHSKEQQQQHRSKNFIHHPILNHQNIAISKKHPNVKGTHSYHPLLYKCLPVCATTVTGSYRKSMMHGNTKQQQERQYSNHDISLNRLTRCNDNYWYYLRQQQQKHCYNQHQQQYKMFIINREKQQQQRQQQHSSPVSLISTATTNTITTTLSSKSSSCAKIIHGTTKQQQPQQQLVITPCKEERKKENTQPLSLLSSLSLFSPLSVPKDEEEFVANTIDNNNPKRHNYCSFLYQRQKQEQHQTQQQYLMKMNDSFSFGCCRCNYCLNNNAFQRQHQPHQIDETDNGKKNEVTSLQNGFHPNYDCVLYRHLNHIHYQHSLGEKSKKRKINAMEPSSSSSCYDIINCIKNINKDSNKDNEINGGKEEEEDEDKEHNQKKEKADQS
mmetsp:Transcript_2908/g.4166  ORF Transcript_2908/g.4166 Transcript_2908/m.4166 type:complete len:584 (+) Transcript_2908:427-2178(+)